VAWRTSLVRHVESDNPSFEKTLRVTLSEIRYYPKALAKMKHDGELWRCSKLQQAKYLNNIVEQDHRRIKRLTGPGLGFGGFWTARRTPGGL
jgi:transposase-like protein